MPNRWIRVNGVLTPKIAPKGVDQEDVVVLADYTFTDDFNHANQTATALIWTVKAEGAYATNATGIKLTTGAIATQTGGILKLGANNAIDSAPSENPNNVSRTIVISLLEVQTPPIK